MLKLLGAMLIIAACTALGIKSVMKKRKTLKAIRELADTLSEISRSINFQLDPLPDVIQRLSREQFSNENHFVKQLSTQMEQNPTQPLYVLWQNALSHFTRENSLPRQAQSIMSAIGESLGKMDYETELKRLDSGKNALTSLLDEISKDHEKTEKMTKSLGIILGIFIVILLL